MPPSFADTSPWITTNPALSASVTPFCITYDFDSETDGCVTVRDRDTMEQVRMPIGEVRAYIEEKIKF